MRTLLILIVAVFGIGAGVFAFIEMRKTEKLEQRIKDVENRKETRIKLDSLRNAIEDHIRDSIAADLAPVLVRVKSLENQLAKQRQANEDLSKQFNALRVSMPEF